MLEIKNEINYSSFLFAIILDETTNEATKSQSSTIIYYVKKDRTIEEWFLGFKNVSDDRTANDLSHHVFKTEYALSLIHI